MDLKQHVVTNEDLRYMYKLIITKKIRLVHCSWKIILYDKKIQFTKQSLLNPHVTVKIAFLFLDHPMTIPWLTP